MVVLDTDANLRTIPEHLPFFDKQNLSRNTRVDGQTKPANGCRDDFTHLDALSFRDTWRAWCAKMHADRYHDRIRCINADGACLCQRLSFTDVMKGMNTASKRVPQFNPPTLSNTGVQIIHQTYPNNAVEFFLFSGRIVVVYNT
jgi:hypothetical protein